LLAEVKVSPDRILLASAQTPTMSIGQGSVRVRGNFLAVVERVTLDELCRRLPNWMMPDHLTAIGFGGAIVTAAGYVASAWRPECLFLACSGLFLNWFGDSLDGSLARHRGIERPFYGYFIDHSVDALSQVVIMVGLGLSPYVNMSGALFALVGYMLIGIHVFIKNNVTGLMQLSFFYFGPTEARVGLAVLTCTAYFTGQKAVTIMNFQIQSYSLIAASFGTICLVVFVADTIKTARFLLAKEA
jgi:phosphatidylglycerophosphate synthase